MSTMYRIMWLAAVCLILISLLLVAGPNLSSWLFLQTGEEATLPQITGVVQLAFNLVRPPLHLAEDVPVAHAGVNPYGVNTFLQTEPDPLKRRLAMEMVANAGFHWIRQEFPWEDIEIHGPGDFEDRRHDPPRSAWEKYDHIVDLAEAYDIEIIARLSNPPAWSRVAGDDAGPFAPPDDLDAYGDFVEAVVRRYKGRIHTYQIWNEPNIYPEWGERPVNAAEYVELLKVGYTRAKAIDPDVVIVAGALAATIELDRHPHGLTDALFLQQMYDAGAAPYFDVLSMQGYGLWSGPHDRRMQPRVINFSRPLYIRDVMVRNGDAEKPIWLSEMAWNALPPESPLAPAYGRVSLEQQARYAVLAYERLQSEWPWAGVACYWFLKQADESERDTSPQYYFRILEPDFAPMPVYDALSRATQLPPVMYKGHHAADHWAITYSGTWESTDDTAAILGKAQQAAQDDAGLSFIFEGSALWLVTQTAPDNGWLEVTVDDGPPQKLSLESARLVQGLEIPLATGMPNTQHGVRITAHTEGGQAGPVVAGFVVRRLPTLITRRILGLGVLATGLGLALWGLLLRRRSATEQP
jgi:polysaccharide biosynthesis protein PslG